MSNETQKISELNPATTLTEHTLFPVVSEQTETSNTDISTLRSVLLFDKAFNSIAEGTDGTEKGESYFVYTDATKTAVQGYVNQGGGSYTPLVDINGVAVRYISGQTLRGLDYFTNGVDSFAKLRTLSPLYAGQRVKLKSWVAGGKTGGGEFIAGIGSATDDNGTIAAGNGFYWQRIISDRLSFEDFGAVGDGVLDDTSNIQKAVNYCAKNGIALTCLGKVYAVSTVNFPTDLVIDMCNAVLLSLPSVTTGYTLTISGYLSPAANPGKFDNIRVQRTLINTHQPDTNSVVDGVSFGVDAHNISFYNLKVSGFRDGVCFNGKSAYLIRLYSPIIGQCWRRGMAFYANTDSNENVTIYGGVIADCCNFTFDGTGVYLSGSASSIDVRFFGTSFDYCDISVDLYQSNVELHGCHLENNNNNPHIRLSYTSTKNQPYLIMKGGTMGGGPNANSWSGIPIENSTGRPYLVFITNTGGAHVDIDGTDTSKYMTGVRRTTEIVGVEGDNYQLIGTLRVRNKMTSGNMDNASRPMRPCSALNVILINQYQTAAWTPSYTNADLTYTIDTTNYSNPNSPHSRKITQGSVRNVSYWQDVTLRGGDIFHAEAEIKITSLTAGYVALRVDFYDSAGNVIQSSIKSVSAVTADWNNVWVWLRAPNGTVKAKVQEYLNGFVGTAYFTNEHVWIS
ncbi:EPS depolymerase [Klebsiella phage vB_KpM_FBKp24]|uniref:Pectate lyase superfamily protein domain-containing protein n=1 Tax=Klebsiella phage vB_KpM_FBKp24 TaxID=2801834 RepID=A0A7U0GB98_9CAUD|nr:EPS depolymerase [Klebsiella phage vB_KpM_FBKp24]QQV92016.1 hypothetical protein vBKpMFBKp24_310 [Klebsiella phage vB_KpM_FBKp24]